MFKIFNKYLKDLDYLLLLMNCNNNIFFYFKKNTLERSKYFIIFLPLLIYIPLYLQPPKNKLENDVYTSLPDYFYDIVWFFLYICIGISWYERRQMGFFINFTYLLLIFLILSWFYIYNINKYYALLIIILCFLNSFFLFFYNMHKLNIYASYTMFPLIIWCGYNTYLITFVI